MPRPISYAVFCLKKKKKKNNINQLCFILFPIFSYFFFFLRRPPPISTLFPYTTLFRSLGNLLLLGKIGVFHNRRNASSRLLLLISKHLILCIYLVFRILA